MRPDVSVLIVSWNTQDATSRCLDALRANAERDGVSYEAIIVENGSCDGSRQALEARSNIRLIVNDANRGFAAAVNQAYSAARGDYLLLLNSDAELRPRALRELLGFLQRHPEVAGVGPAYLNPDGSVQHHHYRLPSFAALVGSVSNLRRVRLFRRALRVYRMLNEDFSCPRAVEQPSASCLLLRRSALPPGRLLDESFPIYFNDVVLARRLATRGLQLWMTPNAVVVHALGASTRLLGVSLRRQHLASLLSYAALSQGPYRTFALKLLILAEAGLRHLFRRSAVMPWSDLKAALRGDPGPLPDPTLLSH